MFNFIKNENLKKIGQILGKLLMVVSVFFIIQKMMDFQVDIKKVFERQNILILFFLCIMQTTLIFLVCSVWLRYLQVSINQKLPFKNTILVYTKANLYKYIPGNVLQYVGRNEVAIRENIEHKKVFFATVLDVGTMVFVKFLFSLLTLQEKILSVLEEYFAMSNLLIILSVGVTIATICAFFVLKKYIKNYIFSFFKGVFSYLLNDIVAAAIYLIVVIFVLEYKCDIKMIMFLAGGYTLGSAIGFLTPGVPGGIGVREAVIMFLASGLCDMEIVVTAVVLTRIICVLADVLAYLFATVLTKKELIT
jgi:hypothetical protein